MLYRLKNLGNNSSGQTVVEYVLLLIIVITIILGLVFQFNDAFRNYARNYFGTYLQCLLENGELPNLGAQEAASACDAEYQPFNIASGRPPIYAGEGFVPGQSNREGGARDSSSTAERNAKEPSAASGNERAGGGRPSRFSTSGRTGGSNLRPSSFAANEKGGGSNPADANKAGGAVKTRQVMRRNADGSPQSGDRSFEESGRTSYFRPSKIEEEQAQLAGETLSSRTESGAVARKKVFQQEIQPRKIQSEVENEAMSFSNFLKYLFIAAIIIAVLLFLAGQFMSISKSMEK